MAWKAPKEQDATFEGTPFDLGSLKRREAPKPPIGIFYGPGGIGKTTICAGAPSPVFIAAEDGIGELDVPHEHVDSYEQAKAIVAALLEQEHDFATLVIDSLDWLEPMLWEQVARDNDFKSVEKEGYGKGFAAAATEWRVFMNLLRQLRDRRSMIVLMTAHAQVKKFEDPTSEPYDRYLLKLHEKAGNLLIEGSDFVGFMNYRLSTKESVDKRTIRALGSGERVVHMVERPGYWAKNRYGLPPTIRLQETSKPRVLWNLFAEGISGGIFTNGQADAA
jgi:hypothetical protein